MTEEPVFLTVEHVLATHERVVSEFGGDLTVRDYGLLESAVMMPAARYGGELLHPDLPAMAAAYLFHLCRNHPFADGNKRTALAAAEVFLLLNNHQLTATSREVERLVLRIARGDLPKDEVTAFFRRHLGVPSRPRAPHNR
jgi:death-on-curing protein